MDRQQAAKRLAEAEAAFRHAQADVSSLDEPSRQRYAAARRELEAAEKAAQAILQAESCLTIRKAIR